MAEMDFADPSFRHRVISYLPQNKLARNLAFTAVI
jgi:hypothetical protein